MRKIKWLLDLVRGAGMVGLLVGCGVAAPGELPAFSTVRAAAVSGLGLWQMPDQGVSPILQAIQGARKSLWLETYMFTDHDATTQLVQALCERARAGVDVRVILEQHPYFPTTPGTPASNPNAATYQALAAGGVKVQWSDPRFSYTHEKGMVIDGATAYVMTCNFTNTAFTANREYVVVDPTAADVAEIGRIFQADWNRVPFTPQDPALVVSPDNSRQKLLSLIDGTQKTLVIQSEYLEDPEVAQHLGDRVRAGVDVKVMLAAESKDAVTGQDPNAAEAALLAKVGVKQVIFTQHVKMHAKAMVADGSWAFVGSENLTANSLNRNRELGILVRDPAVVRSLVQTTAKDWAAR